MFTLLKKSDARQVRKVLAGHREAFDPLVERYLPAVYAVAYAHTGNHADAEDVAQEAFLSAFQSLHTLREPAKFEGWVVSITRRAAARLRERKPGQETMGAPVMNSSTTPDPARQELRRLLREEIEQLEEEPREVLLLHYFAGKSAAEIADTLSISREAAKKRLQRARQTLSDNLLAAIHEETPPATGYRKQRTAIMGLVGATTVAWGSGAAAATTAGLWAWIPGGTTGLAAGVAIVAVVAGGVYTVLHDEGPGDDGGVSVAAMNTEALPADGMPVVESPPVPTVPSLPEDLPEAGSEAAAGEAPSLAGLWRLCDIRGELKGAFGPGGDFVLVTQTGENIAIHSSGAVFGAGEE